MHPQFTNLILAIVFAVIAIGAVVGAAMLPRRRGYKRAALVWLIIIIAIVLLLVVAGPYIGLGLYWLGLELAN